MTYAVTAIAVLTVRESWLLSNKVVANPTSENAIALEIDNLKQSDKPWIEIDLSEQHLFAWDGVVPLPVAIKTDEIKSDFKKGVLTLTLPKVEDAPKKTVKVKLPES